MKLNLKETVFLSLFSALMFCSKVILDALPNVHLIAMLIIVCTVLFRAKAIYAVITFVMITGLVNGFPQWWPPYLYLWPILWGVTMLLPRNMPEKIAIPVYMITAFLHGLLYGVMYAPYQALMYGLDFNGMIVWIAAGLPFDLTHGISNLLAAALVLPLVKVLKKALDSLNF